MTFSLYNKLEFIQQLHPAISLQRYNEIDLIVVQHQNCKAIVSLQGGQLLSWQPKHTQQDVLWLSEAEPFQLGNPIRGGIPICYPWFGKQAGKVAHGTARLRLWHLSDWQVSEAEVRLVFNLYNSQQIIEAQLEMLLGEDCDIRFTHFASKPAQVALHTYFNLGNINKTAIFGLANRCFDSLIQQNVDVSSPRIIDQAVDCIYSAENRINHIDDQLNKRFIEVEHNNASDIVLWNPWQTQTSGMNETGYQTMLCLETARIRQKIESRQQVRLCLRVE